jgi:hypothetical protein
MKKPSIPVRVRRLNVGYVERGGNAFANRNLKSTTLINKI